MKITRFWTGEEVWVKGVVRFSQENRPESQKKTIKASKSVRNDGQNCDKNKKKIRKVKIIIDVTWKVLYNNLYETGP